MRLRRTPWAVAMILSVVAQKCSGFVRGTGARAYVSLNACLYKRERMAMAMQHVCIIGGGFGGVYAALELANKAPESIRVTVVDSKERFVFLPLLYELATGTATLFEVAPRFVDVFRDTRIEFVQATATSVDVEKRTATVVCSSNEREISFDVAVVAVGSSPRLDVVQGAMEHSLPFYSVSDAFRLQKELSRLERSDKTIVRVTVVGAGYSGVELACNVAARLGKERTLVTVVQRGAEIMEHSAQHNREAATKALLNFGVSVNTHTSVEEVRSDRTVVLRDSTTDCTYEIPNDLVLWTAGSVPCDFVKRLNMPKDAEGRIQTLATMQVVGHPSLYALGDAASVQGQMLPRTAQVAMQQADTVASNIQLALNGRSPNNKFAYSSLGEMLTLGPVDGSIVGLNGLVALDGLFASLARRLVYSVRMPTNTQRLAALVGAGIFPLAQALSELQKASEGHVHREHY